MLTIPDHLNWTEEGNHLPLLQKNINTYVAFVESEQLLREYPSARDRVVRVDVAARYPLSEPSRR